MTKKIPVTSFPKEKIKILLAENVHQSAIEVFKRNGYTNIETHKGAMHEAELMKVATHFHIVGIRSKTKLSKTFFEKASSLLAIGAFCIGTNQVDINAATGKGLALFNSPYSNTRSVAELTIAEAIMLMRRTIEKNAQLHQGIWNKESKNSFEVRGKTLGIIGYGHIGSQVSILAEAVGMRVLYYDVVPRMVLGNAHACKSLSELLAASDVITLHVPSLASTKNMINATTIKQMKVGAKLINNARGDVADVEAVAQALLTGKLGGYATDVFPNEPESNNEKFSTPLQQLPNVILTPHIGGSTEEAQYNIGEDVAMKLVEFIDSGSSMGSLTIPELSLPLMQGAHRLLHIHRNVPGVLSEINGILSSLKVNILGQYLKTNNHVGYVVLDVDKKTSPKLISELKTVGNTIKVRNLF